MNRTEEPNYAGKEAGPSKEEVAKKYQVMVDRANHGAGMATGRISQGGDSAASPVATRERPSLGETVMVDLSSGGKAFVKPGIVTAVWGPHCVNVRVLNDGDDVQLNSLGHKSQVPPPSSYAQSRPRYWYSQWEGGPIS